LFPEATAGACRDPSLKLLLENCGFKNVIEMDEMETIKTGKVQIMGIPFFGEHADLDIRSKMAWLIKIGFTPWCLLPIHVTSSRGFMTISIMKSGMWMHYSLEWNAMALL
jgi:hypothetical protein